MCVRTVEAREQTKKMCAKAPFALAQSARTQPPDSGQREQHVFVRTPSHRSGNMLGATISMRCDFAGNPFVNFSRVNREKSHSNTHASPQKERLLSQKVHEEGGRVQMPWQF